MQLKIVNTTLANGVVGEFATSDPRRARGFYLCSTEDKATAANDRTALNVVGNVMFHSTKDDRIVGHFKDAGEKGAVAGILGFPKVAVRQGLFPCCGTQVLNTGKNNVESDPIMNNQMIEMIQQGYVFVKLWNPTSTISAEIDMSIGAHVYYSTETGKLTSIKPDGKILKDQKYARLQGATVAINNIAKPADNTYAIATIYIDLAGDATQTIATA